MKVVLAEKPSVARDLAQHLGARTKRNGYLEGNGYCVTWAFGHLVTLKEPKDYDANLRRWSLTTLPFIPKQFGLNVIAKSHTQKQFQIVCQLFRNAQELICATDAGREGELIFRYIQTMSGCSAKPFFRLWLSSLTDQAIATGFKQLRRGSDFNNLYMAARCRSQADWIVGINATRYYTLSYGQGILWSIGRVQTPVLAMIVKREEEIENFVSRPFWELYTKYRDISLKFSGKRFEKYEDAQQMLKKCRGEDFYVKKIEKKKEKENPPFLYDLTSFQREMNKQKSLSADNTLKILQVLYEKKLITYPRTDSRYLSSDMKSSIPNILHKLSQIAGQKLSRLNLQQLPFSKRIINNAKVSDHHAIIPTGKIVHLSDIEAFVFDEIVNRFIAVFYPACVKDATYIEGVSNQVPFKVKGITIVEPGWTVLYPKKQSKSKDKKEEVVLPEFQLHEKGPHQPYTEEKKTQPPKSYTENTLLAAMENAGKIVEDQQFKDALKERGLGTAATRASIIETLLQRNYVVREKKLIRATNNGRYLVSIIDNNSLKSAEFTGEWEYQLKEVERGNLSSEAFMGKITAFITQLFQTRNLKVNSFVWGNCPLCNSSIIRGKKGYGCSKWKEGCKFVFWPQVQGQLLTCQQVRELLQLGKLTKLLPIQKERSAGRYFVQLTTLGQTKAWLITDKKSNHKTFSKTKSKTNFSPKTNKSSSNQKQKVKSIGSCPLCKNVVIKNKNGYQCSQTSCRFFVPLQIAGKKIQSRTVSTLLKNGNTSILKGFKNNRDEFSGRLYLENGRVVIK
ncbi:DNA topoisomerase 3 [Candidatus Uabimicrobium sp. HlEnr_7]|uniref:type IA DNA topoisomerase n=1 Tax=Candidatus Uabimicrobium helgolandensis TaxID=3095367 RepID=UPI0035560845